MKAHSAKVLVIAWFIAGPVLATESDWQPRSERFVFENTHLVLAEGAGYRFRGGDVISAGDGWHGGKANQPRYSFRPRRGRPQQIEDVQANTRAEPKTARAASGYAPYYPADPYLPYATTAPFGPALRYPEHLGSASASVYPE